MNFSEFEWANENEWLQKVLEEIQKQLEENRNLKESFEGDYIKTQRDMWKDIGSVSIINGLDQITDFMQFINATKTQKRSHEFTRKLEEKYERMLLSPYFGRVDFHENGNEKAEKCYIGISNLIDEDYDFLVYDWRAPISSMFYEYEIGDAEYVAPDGVISGKLTLKRQYKISNGKIEYMFDSNLKIDDEILQDILGKNTDDKMKAIVTTIQREQNRVIRNEEYKNLIVQGPAGSGKTSVALHRIAYLLYKHRNKITPQNIIIFSPNDIFNDYISNVLPQLGEDNMHQTTFKEYMHTSLGDGFIKENYGQMMEYILSSIKNDAYQKRINSIKFKSSIEFIDILKRYVSYLEQKDRDFTDVVFGDKIIVPAKDIKELFYEDYARMPIKSRLQKIKNRILYLVEPYEKERINEVYGELFATGSYIDKEEVMEHSVAIVRKEMERMNGEINRMTKFDLLDIYKRLFVSSKFFSTGTNNNLSMSEINEIKRYTLKSLKSGVLNYEDQVALLYLKGVLGDLPKTSEIKYVIIDEAQDYTPLQYEIFYQLFSSANITMLGDLQQSINPVMNVGDYENITHIFPKDTTCLINLTKSYRSTMEITMFSRRLLNKNLTDECVERSGDKPLIISLPNKMAINKSLSEDIKKYKENGYKSIGIITRTVKEANEVYNSLSDKVHIKAILKDDDEYVSDTLVIPAYLAKGLEFDVVFIYNAGEENYSCEEERLLLYTACTRALHVLRIYYSGELTPLLKEAVF
ncbi:MAG: RNA polymerase recycling motor HelD [Ruminiclostridium sp.]|nr:RNA polymerase recycling motor HelD [Ruminiclostridium sp.]